MTGNPTDKTILRAFKAASDRAARDQALKKIRSQPLAQAFRSLCEELQKEPEASALQRDLTELVSARMLCAAEYVFLKHATLLADLDMAGALRVAATPKCFQAWIQQGSNHQARLDEAIEHVRSAPIEAGQSVLAWWFFSLAPSAKLISGIPALLELDQSRSYVGNGLMLAAAFGRDKDGIFSAGLISKAGSEARTLENLTASILSDGEAFDHFLRLFPRIAESITLELAKSVPSLLFSSIKHETASGRRHGCSQILRLAAGLMDLPHGENADAILSELDRLCFSMENVTSVSSEKRDTCGIRYLGHQRTSHGSRIGDEGADLVALAVDKIHRGDNPLLVMEATAFNLGLRSFGAEGAVVVYDPIIHHDIRGGLMPGDSIKVVRKGWKLGERIVERAKVDLNA